MLFLCPPWRILCFVYPPLLSGEQGGEHNQDMMEGWCDVYKETRMVD